MGPLLSLKDERKGSSMKDRRKFTLLGTATALLAGLAAVMAIPYFSAGTPTTERILGARPIDYEADGADELSTPSSQPISVPNPVTEMGGDKLRQNDARPQRLKQRVDDTPPLMQYEELTSEQLTPEEARATALNWWEETKMAFEQEQVDREWAGATSQLFESDIAQLAEESRFSLVYTECRTMRCSAVVQWPSYAEASVGFDKLLHHAYEANCTRQTLLPEPSEEEADQPYETTVIYDCSEWRKQG